MTGPGPAVRSGGSIRGVRTFAERGKNVYHEAREEISMQTVLTVQSMRESDAAAIAAGTPGRELMARAARAVFEAVPWEAPVAIVCGKGNNGGDGYALACLLHGAGIACTLFAPEPPATADAAFYAGECAARGLRTVAWKDAEDLRGYRAVADCIFGTGFKGEAAGEAARMIRLLTASGAYVVSVDINSGLNGENGLGGEAVCSDLTVSIGSPKPGHFLGRAKDVMKTMVNADIGIPPAGHRLLWIEEQDGPSLLPPRPHFSNKGTYGTAVLIGGSLCYSGAIRLAALANAAMRSGAGIARIAAPASLAPVVASAILESTLFPLPDRDGQLVYDREKLAEAVAGTRAAAFGMGAGNNEETRKILEWLVRNYGGTLILDADALNALSQGGTELLNQAAGRVILTPHPGEFARLTGLTVPRVLDDPVGTAEEFAGKHAAIVLLKGTATVVTDGETTYLSDRGCPGMATAGSGDVLSGVLAALCAWRGEDPVQTTALAAWLNGRAGEIAQERAGDISMTAGDTVQALPEAFRQLRGQPFSAR